MKKRAFAARGIELIILWQPVFIGRLERPKNTDLEQIFSARRSYALQLFRTSGPLRPRRGADVTNVGESLYDEV